ncbi:MAG: hypothetical protein M3Y27_29740 [Acidobacteriota bacterium]|nr:hypothetical protein [Acidobacteriota bacterium]
MTGWIEADDFTFAIPARIESITFSDLEAGNNFQGSIFWRIYSNASDDTPGTVLYSGLSTSVTHTATGFTDYPVSEFVNTVAITPVDLPVGTYWLALHNGPLSNSTNKFVYWEQAAGAGARPSELSWGPLFQGPWNSNSTSDAPTSELIFQLIGVAAPQVTAVSRSAGRPQITFTTSANRYYRVEYKNSLSDSTWTPVSGAESISGTGSPVQVTDPDPNVGNLRRRFYRAIVL